MKERLKDVFNLFLTIICSSALAYIFLASIILKTNPGSTTQQLRDLPSQGDVTTRVFPGAGKPRSRSAMACNLPKLNPFDPSIMAYISKPKANVRCDVNPKYPPLFETDFDNNLITLKDPVSLGLDNCCYKRLGRATIDSECNYWESAECVPLEKNTTKIPAKFEFIAVLCATNPTVHEMENGTASPSKRQVVDAFAFIPIKTKVDTKSPSSSTADPLSVVILGLDSISHMHFIRTMPKTHKYLTQNLSAFGMNGYVKVAENTLPNMMAMLTGLNNREMIQSCWSTRTAHFDNCSFIWKNFSARGYLTSYWENKPGMSTFNYRKEGFNDQPTDYYQRPLSIYQKLHLTFNGSSRDGDLCLGSRFNVRVLLDNIERMAWTMEQEPRHKYFLMHWENTLAHRSWNLALLGDSMILSTLKFLKENGFLNHTVFILMSDHGRRGGKPRLTIQGKIEDSMPFLYFILPDWFSKKYPKANRNIEINRNRLTTPFDLHETLLDILDMEDMITDLRIVTRQSELNSDEISRELPRGISLFLPVPASRTCELAGIPTQWCICHKSVPIFTKNKQVKRAAKEYVQFLQRLLKPYPECSALSLLKIRRAEMVQPENTYSRTEKQTVQLNKSGRIINLILETVPGNALFEVTMKYSLGKWNVASDARINQYGAQSDCVWRIEKLKNYCYCKNNAIEHKNQPYFLRN